MKIEEIRIYAEVLEQGIDFKDYFLKVGLDCNIKNIYAKKGRNVCTSQDPFVTRLRNCKDVDVLITIVSGANEYPFLMVEYSTAVPTDDHKMQRSDVYFWGGVFKVPELKISPDTIGMNQDFGGGDRFTDEQEQIIALRHDAILFPIPWHTVDTFDVLATKENRLSCIQYSKEIFSIIIFLLNCFEEASDYIDLYNIELRKFKKRIEPIIKKYEHNNLHTMIVDSTRFKWERANHKLITKINRFGHAMDPERGALFFVNMLVGFESAVTEIQVNRPSNINQRGGYSSLFDSTSRKDELIEYVTNIINTKNNVFNDVDAITVFRKALNIPDDMIPFRLTGSHKYVISDDDLFFFLLQHPSITTKSIFFLTSELRLTDKNRNVICSVTWNFASVKVFLSTFINNNFIPINIRPLGEGDMKEDLITYSSVELYKKLNYSFAAISYPGAQGDRPILIGNGRRVNRTYVDIIAYKKDDDSFVVFLEECKDNLINSSADVQKLNNLINNQDQLNGLKALFRRTIRSDNFQKVYISVGGEGMNQNLNLDVDYIFMFKIKTLNGKPVVEYTIALIDLSLVETFKSLKNSKNKLQGEVELDNIFVIV